MPMSTSPRLLLSARSITALLAGSLLAAACSDSTVNTAVSNRLAVEAEAEAYATVDRGSVGYGSELASIVSRLDPVARDGDPAANLLLARVRLDLGRLSLDAAIAEETSIANRRSAALSTLAAAAAFQEAAETLRGIEFDAERQRLEAERTAAESGVSSSRTLLREIDEQTRVREAEIERLGRSVRAAEEQATGYRDLASREDVIGAPELLMLAANARADAGRFRVGIAEERSRLVGDVNRTPRHTRAEGDLAVSTAAVEGSSRGLEALDGIDASIRRQADALATTAEQLRAPIATAAADTGGQGLLGGDRIAARLEQARSAYVAAASAAGRTASAGDRALQASADALRMNAAFGELAVDLLDAERLASEAALIAALGAPQSPGVVPATTAGATLAAALRDGPAEAKRLREAASEARQRAMAKLESLQESVDAFQGNGAVARILQAELAAAIDRLAGVEAAPPAESMPASAGGSGSAGGPPFASIDDLVEYLSSGAIANATPDVQEKAIVATSRGAKRMLEVSLDLNRSADDVRTAMLEVYGTAATMGPGGFGALEGGEVVAGGGDEAEYASGDQSIRLVRRDGYWYVDFDSFLASAGMADPTAMAAAAEMMSLASGQLGPFFRMFAQRIRDGEFADADAAEAALTQSIAQMMMQAAGGAAGRR